MWRGRPAPAPMGGAVAPARQSPRQTAPPHGEVQAPSSAHRPPGGPLQQGVRHILCRPLVWGGPRRGFSWRAGARAAGQVAPRPEVQAPSDLPRRPGGWPTTKVRPAVRRPQGSGTAPIAPDSVTRPDDQWHLLPPPHRRPPRGPDHPVSPPTASQHPPRRLPATRHSPFLPRRRRPPCPPLPHLVPHPASRHPWPIAHRSTHHRHSHHPQSTGPLGRPTLRATTALPLCFPPRLDRSPASKPR